MAVLSACQMPFRFGLPATRAGRAAWVSAGDAIQKPPATIDGGRQRDGGISENSRCSHWRECCHSVRALVNATNAAVDNTAMLSTISARFRTLAPHCVFAIVATLGAEQRAPVKPQPAPAPIELFEVHEQSILDLQAAQASGRVTSRGLVESYLARIQAYDQAGPRLNAIVLLNPRAREEADAMDRERADKKVRGPLHGIPVLIKDNYDTADMPTSGGALGLATLQPAADAFQVKKLRDAGAVILGKTTMHELAAGITTISSLTAQTRNPYDLYRVPGGSSGGTGAAIGASFAAAGMGSDTCGSIRIPAANQNLVGLRGTHGLSSRSGVMPLSSTQDIAGPLARSVTDLAIMLDATVGPDATDAITAEGASHIPKSYRDALDANGLKGARIGVLRALWGNAPEDDEVAGIVRKALDGFKAQGAEVVDIVVPGLDELPCARAA